MQFDVTYSIRMALEEYIPELNSVEIMEEGLRIENFTRPLASIQYVQTLAETLAAGRLDYQDDLAYSIGIHARNLSELNRLESKVRDTVIRKVDGIPFYAFDPSNNTFNKTSLRLALDETSFTPMGADDPTEESTYHRGYFVTTVLILRTMGEEGFTQ